jgi:hypothetical protein
MDMGKVKRWFKKMFGAPTPPERTTSDILFELSEKVAQLNARADLLSERGEQEANAIKAAQDRQTAAFVERARALNVSEKIDSLIS